jgi:hypothetical protein
MVATRQSAHKRSQQIEMSPSLITGMKKNPGPFLSSIVCLLELSEDTRTP